MRKPKYLIMAIGAIVLMGIIVTPTHAQSQDLITAKVDRTNVTTDDLLTLTVSVDAAAGNTSRPELPPLDGFTVLSSSRGTQMTIINGQSDARLQTLKVLDEASPSLQQKKLFAVS